MDFWASLTRVDACLLAPGNMTIPDGRTPAEVAWDDTFGVRTPGYTAIPACGNSRCVSPDHLRQVPLKPTARRGARVFGVKNGQAKLTEREVRDIRRRIAEGATQSAIAKEFGLTQATISRIARRIIWPQV